MILDNSRISLEDGSDGAAIDVQPGRNLATHRKRFGVVTESAIQIREDVIGLILSNGKRLIGTRDQLVCKVGPKVKNFKAMAEIEIGDKLLGWKDGMNVILSVTGIVCLTHKQVRMVSLKTTEPYIADGVVCRF
jgi:hypothetical protein